MSLTLKRVCPLFFLTAVCCATLLFACLSEAAEITLNGTSIAVSGSGVTVNNSIATITSSGTYNITGNLDDGQIIVDTQDEEVVTLEFKGINIYCSTSAPVYVMNAERIIIDLMDDTENYVTDSASYIVDSDGEPDATIFSKDDLEISGSGSLTVDANYNNGIKSKDGLVISGGDINVVSVDDGIIGKDYIDIADGNITINAEGDGFKSTNDNDADKGYILIEEGTINIISGADAIQAETDVVINGGDITLVTAGGSGSVIGEDETAKGIKSPVDITINNGEITIDSADDSIHSNDTITINGGVFYLSSTDDAVHSDTSMEINGGEFNIVCCYEGIESGVITINNGNFYIVSTDDGINIAGGNDGSGDMGPGGPGGGFNPPSSGDYYLYINGGYIFINSGGDIDSDGDIDSEGDGIDVNGSIEMTGGTIIINGPIDSPDNNGALDYDAGFKITGGFIIGAGSSAMAQAPDNSSTQYSVLLTYSSVQDAGTMVHVQSDEGQEIFTFEPVNDYNSLVFSSPDLVNGSTYYVFYGGASNGTDTDGLYEGGIYRPGTRYTKFTITSIITQASRCSSIDSDNDGTVDCVDDFPYDGDEWLDTDGDGIGNNADTDDDNDGMPDEWENQYSYNPLSDDSGIDYDSDGLTGLEEYQNGTDPNDADSDHDGLGDGDEVNTYGSSPVDDDTDDDGINDGIEVNTYGTSPTMIDTDGDSMPDGWEIQYEDLDPNVDDASADPDGDGYSNFREYLVGKDPMDADSHPVKAMPWLPLLLED